MFKIKFQKSKYPIFKISFWIILICSLLLILNIIRINAFAFKIKNIYPTKLGGLIYNIAEIYIEK